MEFRLGYVCCYFCIVFCLICLRNVSCNAFCPHGFKFENDPNQPKNAVCIAYFKKPETWERAYNICRHYSSYLYYYKAVGEQVIQKFSNETVSVHIGIRRKNGVYLWSQPNPREFRQYNILDVTKLNLLWEVNEPRYDCVNLNLLTKNLTTIPCNETQRSFVCIGNMFPENSILCDEDWEFSYLSGNCIKKSQDSLDYITASRKCKQSQGKLISYETSEALTSAFLFENIHTSEDTGIYIYRNESRSNICTVAYWNGNMMHQLRTNCRQSRQYVCQKDPKEIDVKVNFTKDHVPAMNYAEFKKKVIMYINVNINGKPCKMKDITKITWWKDDIPVEGYTPHNSSFMPALYVNTPDVTKQGRYYASVVLSAYPYTVYSKTVEIYLSDVSTFLLTITGKSIPYVRNIHDYSKISFVTFRINVTSTLNEIFHDFNIPNLPKPDWHLSNINDSANSVTLHLYMYLKYFNTTRPKNEKNDVYVPLRNYINNKVRMMAFANWNISSVNFNIVGQCFQESKQGNNNINITWHDSYHARYIVSTPPCITNDWELVTRTCHGGYLTGAKWDEFDYSKCSRRNEVKENFMTDECRSGYDYWKHDTCIGIHRETADWFEAQRKCSEGKGYLFSPKISSDFTLQEFDSIFEIGEIWLGGRRNFNMFEWLAFYPEIINTDQWELGETTLLNDCLSGKIFGRKLVLYSRSCHEKKAFVCMHKALREYFYASPRCPINWKMWPFSEENCYKHTNVRLNWTDTRDRCLEQGGKLTVLSQYNQNFIVKNYILQLDIEDSLWWIGLRRTNNGFIWEDERQKVWFVDWDPTTNFSLENTAGCLRLEDDVKWFLDNPSQKNLGICERKANKGRAVSQVIQVNAETFKCLSDRRYYKSVTWYKDGFVVNGTRGLMEEDDEYLVPFKLLSPTNIHLSTLGRLQGYYWCEVDQENPFQPVSSNKELFIIEDMWTFSGELLSRTILNHFDPSTSKFWDKNEEINRKIEQHFLPKTPFLTSLFIHHLTVEEGNTKMMFYIYVEKNSKKRSEKSVSKMKYKEYLENQIESTLASSNMAEEMKLILNSLKITNSGECFKETINVDGIELTWNETRSGKFAIANGSCVTEKGDPVIRRCLGNFTVGSYWGPVEGTCSGHLSNISVKLRKLSQEVVINPKQTSKNLKELTNASSELRAIDLHYVAVTMENLAEVNVHQRTDVQDVISTMDNIMNMDPAIIISSKTKVNASTRITASIESILEKNKDMLAESKPNLVVYSWSLKQSTVAGMMVMSSDENNLGKATPIMNDISMKKMSDKKCRAGIFIPPDLIQERSIIGSSIDFVIYKNDSLFLSENYNYKIISPVMYSHISGGPVLLERKSIHIVLETFQVPNQIPNSERCVYWDYSLNNGQGGWSDEGCEKKIDPEDGKHIKCFCDHMTNFAILVDLYGSNVEDENHAVALDIITYIGCTLSIFGLLLTIVTFLIFKKLRKGLGSQVLCNLAISLLLTLIVFVIGIDQISSKAGCIFVAVLLHYFLLVAFCWMLVEAVLQYLRFVKVIGTYIPKFMLKASLCAWGIPLLITLTILAIDYNMYHGGRNYCWLKVKPFYYGFLVPVGIIMLANIIIFCLVIYSISCGRQKGLRTNQSERKLAITRLRAAFCILFLLGLSWIFGFFAISDARLIFKYLFSIFTTLQGFFIFVFHVVQEKTTRDLWYSYFCLRREHGIQIFTRDTSSGKETITSSSSITRNKSPH